MYGFLLRHTISTILSRPDPGPGPMGADMHGMVHGIYMDPTSRYVMIDMSCTSDVIARCETTSVERHIMISIRSLRCKMQHTVIFLLLATATFINKGKLIEPPDMHACILLMCQGLVSKTSHGHELVIVQPLRTVRDLSQNYISLATRQV